LSSAWASGWAAGGRGRYWVKGNLILKEEAILAAVLPRSLLPAVVCNLTHVDSCPPPPAPTSRSLLPCHRSEYLVGFLGAYIAPDNVTIVTELCPGGTLFRALQSRPQEMAWQHK